MNNPLLQHSEHLTGLHGQSLKALLLNAEMPPAAVPGPLYFPRGGVTLL